MYSTSESLLIIIFDLVVDGVVFVVVTLDVINIVVGFVVDFSV